MLKEECLSSQFEIIAKEIVMEEYIIETFKNHVGETMYKLIEVNEYGDKRELARLDYIQLQDLQFNIESKIDQRTIQRRRKNNGKN